MKIRRSFSAIAVGLVLTGCGSSSAATSASPGLSGSITVLAAASLTAAFTKIGADFEKAFRGTTVHFSFAGSATLVTQVEQGAQGDVFASADQPNMQKLVDASLVQGPPSTFAHNRLEIVVARGNPHHIGALSDLARPGEVVILCALVVPCGRYANQALQKAGVSVSPASLETDVKAVTSKVAVGEADAGIVYITDVKAAGAGVEGVSIPDNLNVLADYPIVVLKDSQNVPLAKAFVSYVLDDAPAGSSGGQRTLRQYGFLGP
jgi:molybdate transport system substrate-binding protein